MPNEIPYHVHFISSVDPDAYSHTKVNNPTFINFVGWMSERDSVFPQSLILRFDSDHHVEKLQLVAHHTFVPCRVEVFTSDGSPLYNKLCDVAFGAPGGDENAAERKTITVKPTNCTLIKLSIHSNHHHEKNQYNQVGLLSARFFGGKAPPEEPHSDGYVSDVEAQRPRRRHSESPAVSSSVDSSSEEEKPKKKKKKKKKEKKEKHTKGPCGCEFCAILDGPSLSDKVNARLAGAHY